MYVLNLKFDIIYKICISYLYNVIITRCPLYQQLWMMLFYEAGVDISSNKFRVVTKIQEEIHVGIQAHNL